VLGYDTASQAHQVRQLIGLTGQYASVDETLTGSENLTLIGRLTGLSRTDAKVRASHLLTRFRLTDAAARAVKTYSGGLRSTWRRPTSSRTGSRSSTAAGSSPRARLPSSRRPGPPRAHRLRAA
jgi:hypothetical protein